MKDTVYYLPGMGGRLNTGLGRGIHDRGYKVVGRETLGEFQKYSFQDKIDLVANDLEEHFWHEKSKVFVNSFGAYLFLHAQLQMKPYPGQLLILSPIIGGSNYNENMMRFYPPRADTLLQAATDSLFPCPLNAQIYVGSEDWQSGPEDAVSFGSITGIPVAVVDKQGHMLNVNYVGGLLDELLGTQD
ncbi:hypothetical protein N8Z91_02820 [Ascidiaceihabitans sp.]|nr:hypothetical protein [Ascidiaceihabitans sp.]